MIYRSVREREKKDNRQGLVCPAPATRNAPNTRQNNFGSLWKCLALCTRLVRYLQKCSFPTNTENTITAQLIIADKPHLAIGITECVKLIKRNLTSEELKRNRNYHLFETIKLKLADNKIQSCA